MGLQEVLLNGQVSRIAKALNFNFTVATHPSNNAWWGVAILSKYPITDAKAVQVSFGARASRSASIATIDVDGTSLVVASFHKALDKDTRDGSSFRNLKSAIEGSGLPTVLTGDFNVTPNDRRFGLLGSDFLDTTVAVDTPGANEVLRNGTWGSGLGYRIDYVLVQQSKFDVIDAGLVLREHRMASDHYAYFAKIRLKH